MNFITQLAHAGHHHDEAAATNGVSTPVTIVGVVVVVAVVAVALTVLNARKKAIKQPADDELKSQ